MRNLTLQELGNRLPIPNESGEHENFVFRAWRLPEEKKISEIKNKQKNLGKFIREVYEFMIVELGGKKLEGMAEGEKKLLFNRMPFANMFYLWIYLRYEALGEQLKMTAMTCPHCAGSVKDFVADLNSLEVKSPGFEEVDGAPIEKREKLKGSESYKLKKPFPMGDIHVHGLEFGYTPWDAMERLPSGERSHGAIKEAMMKASIHGGLAAESEKPLSLDKEKVLNLISKKDIEGYYDALDKFNGGPVMAVTVPCPHCDQEFHQPLNWTYEYFFGSLSL